MNQTNINDTDPVKLSSKRKSLKFSYESLLMGIFWMLCGFLLFIHNVVELSSGYILLILFLCSAYLIILSILRKIRKLYFVLGLILFSFFLSVLVIEYGKSQLRWPIIMAVLSIGIVAYGILFKAHSRIKYIIPGVTLLGISILVFISAVSSEKMLLSELLYQSWPILLIFLGGYQIRELLLKRKIKKASMLDDANIEEPSE